MISRSVKSRGEIEKHREENPSGGQKKSTMHQPASQRLEARAAAPAGVGHNDTASHDAGREGNTLVFSHQISVQRFSLFSNFPELPRVLKSIFAI